MRIFTVVFSVFFAVVLAACCGLIFWGEYGLLSLAADAAMILSLPFASLMHELGHMLFGAAAGIKAVPQFKIFGSSSCGLVPKTDKHLKARVGVTAVGGFAVNALFIILGIVAVIVPQCPSWLAVFMPASVYLYFMNVMPVQFAGGKSDGLIVSELAKNTAEAQVLLVVLKAQAHVLKGKPIEQLDENLLFALPQIREDDQSFIALTELRYKYCLATGDPRAETYKARFEQLKEDYC